MAAVCEMEHWKERIEARPENRKQLMNMKPSQFIGIMAHWREYFLRGADLPVIGATEAELRSIQAPALVIPGNDNTHSQKTGERLGQILRNAQVHILFPKHYDMDLSPREEWDEKAPEMARLFAEFMTRNKQAISQ